ncbi:MAG: acyl carrier protein [SAR86 cluster bacterium]|jgi:acyl carrier protein|nr:acyl carrier protein [SAR86 cluster bacterium]
MLKNIDIIISTLNIDDITDINRSSMLDDYEWDSLAIVILQTYFADEFELEIDPEELMDFKTFGELDDFISMKN